VRPEEKRLYIWLPEGDDPARHQIEYGVRPFTVQVNSQYITVAGLTMLYASVGLHGEFNVLTDCTISHAEFCNLGVSGKYNNVIRCEINYGGNSGVSTWGYGHRIVGGAVRFNNRRLWSRHWHAGGMKNFSSDTLVSDVTAEGNVASPGIWFDGNNTGNTIQNCIAFHNVNGIMYEIGERAIIKNNICYENESRGIDISNSSYMLVAHNLCYRNGKAGIGVYAGTRRGGITYEDEETGAIAARCNVIWGNILMDNWYDPLLPAGETRDGPELIMPDPKYKSNNANVSDYNLFFRTGNRPIRFWYNYKEQVFNDLKDWQTRAGQDRHSLVAEPLFKDLARYDFRPVAKSPAIAMVRSRLGIRLDSEGKDQHHDAMLTAGPFMADKKLQPPDLRATRPEELSLIPLYHHSLPRELGKSLAEWEIGKISELKQGVTIQGVPFELPSPPKAVMLTDKQRVARISVARNVKTLYLAYSLINPARKGPVAHCKIVREDGMTLEVKWEDLNWTLPDKASAPKTVSGWKSKDGKVEVLLTTWANDNEWYPIRELEWTLDDPSATVLIFGVTTK
jgi:parallel beta-helix repeat protein